MLFFVFGNRPKTTRTAPALRRAFEGCVRYVADDTLEEKNGIFVTISPDHAVSRNEGAETQATGLNTHVLDVAQCCEGKTLSI
jgi:hypothetical protein